MPPRGVIRGAVATLVAAARAVAAEPVGVVPAADPEEPLQRSYLVPALETVGGAIALSSAMRVAGVSWAQVTHHTIYDNLTTPPTFDEDPWTINYLGHPWFGAALFSIGRSTGHGFWVSGVYAFGGSLLWEMLLESETPSVNDQITTPLGGMFIGEALHRFSRALLHPGRGRPRTLRRVAAVIVDPVGAINRMWWGDAWAKAVPPPMYAHFGIGVSKPVAYLGGTSGPGQLHLEFVAEHGLTGDATFTPRRPMRSLRAARRDRCRRRQSRRRALRPWPPARRQPRQHARAR